MNFLRLRIIAATSLGTSLFIAQLANAKVTMNAMCFMSSKENIAHPFNPTRSEISEDPLLRKIPTNVTEVDIYRKFRIASLSKVLTTHWATMVLGPNYRFKTKIYISPGTRNNSCHVHLEGDMDPYMGRDMLSRIFTQLKSKLANEQCTSVEAISYDEYFPVLLEVMSHQKNHPHGWENPAFSDNPTKTQNDFVSFIKKSTNLNINPQNIGLVSRSNFREYISKTPHKVYSVKSRPLYIIAKDINKYSFNYPANIIFKKLGGRSAYSNFIEQRLKLTINDVDLYNGSGYPVLIVGEKRYNEVSCAALTTIIKDLDQNLNNYPGNKALQLADVMAVGGGNETYSTFKNLYSSGTFNNTLVAKTGSAERAITFGGMLSTSESDIYFAVLTSPETYGGSDLTTARLYIRSLVQTLAERMKLKKLDYKPIGDMKPFDEFSTMVEEESEKASINMH